MRPILNQLYLMIKPPPELLWSIWELSRTQRTRPSDLLHMTLLCLGDRSWLRPDEFERLVAAVASLQAAAIRVVLEQVEEGEHVVLKGAERLRGVARFQAVARRHFLRCGVRVYDPTRTPHITLSYTLDGRGTEWVDRFSWRANEVMLVESIVGEQRHEVRGRRELAA